MEADKDVTVSGEREMLDLYQRQDNIVQDIRKKETPGFFKRILALLRYFFGLTAIFY